MAISPASAVLGAALGGGAPVVVNLGRSWAFQAATASADPGAAGFRLNNATQSAATAMYISNIADSGVDVGTALLQLEPEDRIYIQDRVDKAKFHLVRVTALPADNTTWVSIPIASVDIGDDLEADDLCTHGFHLGGADVPVVTAPAEFTADQDDLAHAGANTMRVSSDARRSITGLVAGTDGQRLRIINVGATNPVVLLNENVGSAAANRIVTARQSPAATSGAGDVTLGPDLAADLEYNGTKQRWLVLGVSGKDDANYTWSFSGACNTTQNALIPKLDKDHDCEVYAFFAHVQEAPTGQNLIARVVGGTLDVSTEITVGSTTGFSTIVPVKVAANTPMVMQITQVGSGAPGTTLSVTAYTRPV